MISVLCPSRGRVERLVESYKSFGNQNIEFLVAVDKDDPQLKDYKKTGLSITECPRFGYPFLEKYYNILAKKSKGDWLFNWNDDALMQYDNLEELVSDLDPSIPQVVLFGGDKCFPMISRGLYDLIGHFAMGPSVDSYIHAIGFHGKIIVDKPEIFIAHNRIADQTTRELDLDFTSSRMATIEVVTHRSADIEKILGALCAV